MDLQKLQPFFNKQILLKDLIKKLDFRFASEMQCAKIDNILKKWKSSISAYKNFMCRPMNKFELSEWLQYDNFFNIIGEVESKSFLYLCYPLEFTKIMKMKNWDEAYIFAKKYIENGKGIKKWEELNKDLKEWDIWKAGYLI